MYKKIIYLIIFISFLFSITRSVSAQFFTPMIPGKDCGVPGSIETNKCCTPFTASFIQPPDTGNAILNWVMGAVAQPGMLLVNSFMQPLQGFYDQNMSPCIEGDQSTVDPNDPSCRCIDSALSAPSAIDELYKFCERLSTDSEKPVCNTCVAGGGIWTGIGCVQGNLSGFIEKTVFGMGIGLSGGLAFLCIIYAAFMMQSSQGNPEKLKKAQELITSCIMGLMLIIFSIFILKLIGVDILRIPGFT